MTTHGTPPPAENDAHHKNSTDIDDTPVITTITDTTEGVPPKTEPIPMKTDSTEPATTKRPTTIGLPIVSSESIEAISESEEEQSITETLLTFNETIPEASSTTASPFEGVDYKKSE